MTRKEYLQARLAYIRSLPAEMDDDTEMTDARDMRNEIAYERYRDLDVLSERTSSSFPV